jgi:glyceraldehyde 3-phosphate dehydrogenase
MYNERKIKSMAKARVAINGFGRIGRLFFRQAFELSNLEIVAVNDLGDVENLAYLLKYDSVYGRYGKEIKTVPATVGENGAPGNDGKLIVDGKEINFIQVKDPTLLPWKDLQVDIAIESTGLFDSYDKAKVHLAAGAKRVVITAPAKDEDGAGGQTVLNGVNEDNFKIAPITSNGSCTTNSASPVIQVLDETLGIQKAMLATVHAYTATQALVDGPIRGGHDFRKGRAAAHNTVPETTGAAIAVARAIPDLRGKFDGVSFRVPNITGSISSITLLAKRAPTVEEIKKILTDAAAAPRWQGILKVTNDQLVSSDIVGEPYGAIVPLDLIKVVDGDLVNVLSWYDNEAGYVSTLIKHVEKVAEIL